MCCVLGRMAEGWKGGRSSDSEWSHGRSGRVPAATRRVLVFAGLALAGTVVVVLWITATDILWYFPQELRVRWLARNLLGLAAIYAVGRLLAGRREAGRPTADPLRWGLDGLDRLAATAMAGGLTIAIVAACVGLLATWVPHYLFWPWFRDSDTFATHRPVVGRRHPALSRHPGLQLPGCHLSVLGPGQGGRMGPDLGASTPSTPPRWCSWA